jgi:hypothetical protein
MRLDVGVSRMQIDMLDADDLAVLGSLLSCRTLS